MNEHAALMQTVLSPPKNSPKPVDLSTLSIFTSRLLRQHRPIRVRNRQPRIKSPSNTVKFNIHRLSLQLLPLASHMEQVEARRWVSGIPDACEYPVPDDPVTGNQHFKCLDACRCRCVGHVVDPELLGWVGNAGWGADL